MRPRRLVVVTGTGTEVGKTWAAASLLRLLSADGLAVAARKPAQSFGGADAADAATDAHVLGRASGEPPESVCPPHRWYAVPMAPPMAAAALSLPVPTLAELALEVESGWPPQQVDVGVVEGAGGVASPLAADGDTADLARRLEADRVVLVAEAGLGTINLVRLSMRAVEPLRCVVFLNRYADSDPLNRANREWLAAREGFDVAVTTEELAAYT